MRIRDWSSDVCSSDLAKSLQAGGYATAIFGKWHLGEGPRHRPTGFDDWCVLPDQGAYFDPDFIGPDGLRYCRGYATDLIAALSLAWLAARHRARPFFLMCDTKSVVVGKGVSFDL